MFWVFLLLASAMVVEALVGRWGVAVLLYLMAGIAWTAHDRRRLRGQMPMMAYSRPMAYIASMLLLWPLRAATAASERQRKLRDPERYLVSNELSFQKWADALAYARKMASDRNDGVVVLDRARERRSDKSSLEEFHHVMYMVEASGEVREIGL